MRIERIRIENYRSLRRVELGGLGAFNVFVGANGSGKTTLFDIFGFLRDALVHNVRQALAKRGGFHEVVSRGSDGPIVIDLKFRQPGQPLVTYSLSIGLDESGQPVVEREVLKYRRGQHGKPWHFLDFARGKGKAVTNEAEYGKPDAEMERDEQQLDSPDILAVKGLGQFQKFQQVNSFRKLIEGWHVSDFHIQDARPSQEAGLAEHLSPRGDNLPLVAQFMRERYPERFELVLEKMARRVPGIERVEAVQTEDGRLVLKFRDGSFVDPFIARYVSDGTIKMFAYLLLLHDPRPHPLLCIEEPENQLYPDLLHELAEEFRDYAERGGQAFVSSHSPEFVDALRLDEIFWLEKKEGFTSLSHASDDPQLAALLKEGDRPAELWRQGLFGRTAP